MESNRIAFIFIVELDTSWKKVVCFALVFAFVIQAVRSFLWSETLMDCTPLICCPERRKSESSTTRAVAYTVIMEGL